MLRVPESSPPPPPPPPPPPKSLLASLFRPFKPRGRRASKQDQNTAGLAIGRVERKQIANKSEQMWSFTIWQQFWRRHATSVSKCAPSPAIGSQHSLQQFTISTGWRHLPKNALFSRETIVFWVELMTPCWTIVSRNKASRLELRCGGGDKAGKIQAAASCGEEDCKERPEVILIKTWISWNVLSHLAGLISLTSGTPLLPRSLPGEPPWVMMKMKKKTSKQIRIFSPHTIQMAPMPDFIVELFPPSPPPVWRLMMLSPLRPTCSP